MFPDDVKDDSVVYLEQLIADKHPFNKQMWHGGATSEPLIRKPKNMVKKKSATIKQALKPRKVTQTKQRRISSYFTRLTTPSYTNTQLTEIVIQLTTKMKQLRREMKRMKKRYSGWQPSFQALLSHRKKSNKHPINHGPSNQVNMHFLKSYLLHIVFY